MNSFNVGDRVVALKGTPWDTDHRREDDDIIDMVRLHGHYGRVVEHCNDDFCHLHPHFDDVVHVVWLGFYDQRECAQTTWVTDAAWHMYPDEIEHAD